MIAMEDILEEIVGNILDEYDVYESYIREKCKDEYIIEGKTPLDDWRNFWTFPLMRANSRH